MPTGRLGRPIRFQSSRSVVDDATVALRPFGAGDLVRRLRVGTLPPAASFYWVGVVGAGALSVIAAASRLGTTGGWGRFAVLTVAASFAQLSAVQLTRNRVFHPAIVFVVAGALLLTPQQLVLMCVVQHVPDWLKHRYSWYIQPFNIADYVFAAAAAAFTARGLEHVALAPGARIAVAGIAAAAAFVAVNRLLLVVMLRLGRGLSTRGTGLVDTGDVALEYVLALMAVPFAALWGHSATLSA